MIRKYNNPIKSRVWRPKIGDWIKRHFAHPKKRKTSSACCLAGPELLEVEHIYRKIGFGHVVCVELDNGHYRKMCDKRKELVKEGKKWPDIEIVNMDIREYLATTSNIHEVIFLDFDGKSHLIVEECARSIASRRLLPDSGGAFGVNVLGAREHMLQQMEMRMRAGDELPSEQEMELITSVISRDAQMRELLRGNARRPKRKVEQLRVDKSVEYALMNARDVFYTNLLLRTMFKGKGFEELAEIFADDSKIKESIERFKDFAMERLKRTFDLRGVKVQEIEKRVALLIAEVIWTKVPEVYSYLIKRMEERVGRIRRDPRLRAHANKLETEDYLHYLVAKYLGPYLCRDILSMQYTWGNSPMYTDIGFFTPLSGFEHKIGFGLRSIITDSGDTSEKQIHAVNCSNSRLVLADIKRIRKIGRELRDYMEEFSAFCKGGHREDLKLDAAVLDTSLPVINSRDQIDELVEKDPLISADDVFERFSVIGFNWNQLSELIKVKLRKMGLKSPAQKKKERLRIKIVARIEAGATDQEIDAEFYEGVSAIQTYRGEIEHGYYVKGGPFEHLRPFIDFEKKTIE
jgi:hypothetical protein